MDVALSPATPCAATVGGRRWPGRASGLLLPGARSISPRMRHFIPFLKARSHRLGPAPPGRHRVGRARGRLTDAGLAPLIEAAFRSGRPRAVALQINSPGGSPVQSSLIAARIRRLAEEKQGPGPRLRRGRGGLGRLLARHRGRRDLRRRRLDPGLHRRHLGGLRLPGPDRAARGRAAGPHGGPVEVACSTRSGPEKPEDVARLDRCWRRSTTSSSPRSSSGGAAARRRPRPLHRRGLDRRGRCAGWASPTGSATSSRR